LFAKAPAGAAEPELVALYAPPGLDLAQPVPTHVFFTPPPPADVHGPYPYSSDFNRIVSNYLVGGTKRLLNQHNAAGKKCLFVFPVPPRDRYFNGLLPSSNLRRFLLEAAYWLARVVGNTGFPTPRLTYCAASGFSRAGDILFGLMQTSLGSQFPELKEVYCLDVVHEAGAADFLAVAQQWKNASPARRVRIYEHYAGWGASPLAPQMTHRSGAAREWQGPDATLASASPEFWREVFREDGQGVVGYFEVKNNRADKGESDINESVVHQVMPGVFLQHALRNSAFPDG
jgi:hypothetical protein